MDKNDAEVVIKDTIEYANNEIKKNKDRSRRIVIATLVSAILMVALLGSCFISYSTFNTGNPFSVASGYFQITVFAPSLQGIVFVGASLPYDPQG